jgi:SAM-dependent methyltransferase
MAVVQNLSIKEVYNRIANHFDCSRHSVWGSVKIYLDSLCSGASVLELGCGNGKNMLYRKDLVMRGIDISEMQVRICLAKNLTVTEGCITRLDYADHMFDSIICIATYHHLDNDADRQRCLMEMWRTLRGGGSVLLTVWSMEQPASSKFNFVKRDELVPWFSRDDGNTYLRYYHIYRKGDLEEEIGRLCPLFRIVKSGWELGNWYCILESGVAPHNTNITR